jgi:hypothetical protein
LVYKFRRSESRLTLFFPEAPLAPVHRPLPLVVSIVVVYHRYESPRISLARKLGMQ